jgi:hypothetical protein
VAPIDARAVGVATLRNQILYRHDRIDDGYIVERDDARFFSLLVKVILAMKDIAVNYRRLKREYRAAYPAMVSTEAWERRFSESMTH